MRLLFYGARQRGRAEENRFSVKQLLPIILSDYYSMVPEERGSAEENMFMNEATFLPSFYEIIILWWQTERKCGRK
jgi:hypothetical protein